METVKLFAGMNWLQLLVLFAGIIAVIITFSYSFIMIKNRTGLKKAGSFLFDKNDPNCITNHPDVRDYLYQIDKGLINVKNDIRYRL